MDPQDKVKVAESLNLLIKECHSTALDHGFWDVSQNIPEKIMLCVTELAEAVESLRKNRLQEHGKEWSKDTFSDEITDTFIRLFDLCGYMGINLPWQLFNKMTYNESRPRLHGKQF